MLNEKQIERMLRKLKRFETTLEPYIFKKVDEINMAMYQTGQNLNQIPDDSLFSSVSKGETWGGEGNYCWFKGQFKVDKKLKGKTLYIRPDVGGYEAMLWVNGMPFGTFATKIVVTRHGNHYCNMIKQNVEEGEIIDIALEYYAGHYVMGCMPFEENPKNSYIFEYKGIDICVKNEDVTDFLFDLKTFNQMASVLDKNSFVRANIIKTLTEVHRVLYYSPENVDYDVFINSIRKAKEIIKPLYEYKNTSLAPIAAVIGHSHMDTAWLWHIDETIKKCARTYSNQLSLMEQYPEYKFIQSSAYHGKMIKENYPELFERIKQAVKEGRYEPNGAVWVECDCNIVSGETMIRQFLWGQRFTKENFDYTSNAFWLPDTFGYSPSIPQIMKGCRVDYFLTTKMAWNDTNKFPYDTFYWKGLDGTKVLAHMNKMDLWPDPETCIDFLVDGHKTKDTICEKTVSNMRLLCYGFGDGGGGPQFEMIEMARRCKDIEGCPKVEHMLVGGFMEKLEASLVDSPTIFGELYLELHRGTLTNQHTIKRNNRLSEIKLRDLEYLTVRNAIDNDKACQDTHIKPLMETLLVNQFHDILPGTCIPRAHEQSIKETTKLIGAADDLIHQNIKVTAGEDTFSVMNTLPFTRRDVIYLDYIDGYMIEGNYKQQITKDIYDNKKLAISGVEIEAFSSVVLKLVKGYPGEDTSFEYNNSTLKTPFAKITFNEKGYMKSFIDTTVNRELKGEGYALNTLLIAEDVPLAWDSWDIDADYELKLRDSAVLLDSKVISKGEVEFRTRNTYKLTEKSTLTQDIIFYADRSEVRFETKMDWQDDHRLLKTAFDTTVFSDFPRQEMQFGYIKRPTTRNNNLEKAKFEVCNHKYTDLSETRYGVSILNDCKYGISLKNSQMRLTLHKGGCRPDYRGDKGVHYCTYAFLPHNDGFLMPIQ
jgi:alpha-mannosidase